MRITTKEYNDLLGRIGTQGSLIDSLHGDIENKQKRIYELERFLKDLTEANERQKEDIKRLLEERADLKEVISVLQYYMTCAYRLAHFMKEKE